MRQAPQPSREIVAKTPSPTGKNRFHCCWNPQIYADLTITSLNSNAASYEAVIQITIYRSQCHQGIDGGRI
jgi:hypothetical protein